MNPEGPAAVLMAEAAFKDAARPTEGRRTSSARADMAEQRSRSRRAKETSRQRTRLSLLRLLFSRRLDVDNLSKSAGVANSPLYRCLAENGSFGPGVSSAIGLPADDETPLAGMEAVALGGDVSIILLTTEDRRRADLLDHVARMPQELVAGTTAAISSVLEGRRNDGTSTRR